MSCQDKLRDEMPATPSNADNKQGRASLEKCVVECADSLVLRVPGMTQKILETLKQQQY